MVADDGRQQRDLVRLDGRGIQRVHEYPLGGRRAKGRREPRRPRPELRPDQRRRNRAADDVERQQRRQHVQLPDLWQDAADAVHARRHRGRRGGAARDERVHEGLGLQAPLALGLRVSHEPGAETGSGLVLVLLALDDGFSGRIDCERCDCGRADDRDGPAERSDALAGGAQGAVCRHRSRDQADDQREDGQRQHRHRHVARRCLVQRQPDVRGRARFWRPRDHDDHARSVMPFPGQRSQRQCLAEDGWRRRYGLAAGLVRRIELALARDRLSDLACPFDGSRGALAATATCDRHPAIPGYG